MTQEQFLNLTVESISQVYLGKDHCCRCGCGGTYTATSSMKNPRSPVNDKLVERRLNRAKRLVKEGAQVDYSVTYVNVPTGDNRALTFYFDEMK